MRTSVITSSHKASRSLRKAAFAGWIGSAIEYYDFFIYGTASALVFGKIFFPSIDPKAATVASFATFGVAYITRPMGAFVLGHIGDRFGRKKVLTLTLLLMGISTFLVGVLPAYRQAGILAPVLLVTLRLLQGFSAAGQQAGANSMTLEHAPANRRAYYTSFTLSGTQAGLILATLVYMPFINLRADQLLLWGWRIPFLLSAVVVGVGIWVRRAVSETPAFRQEEAENQTPKMPVVELFRGHARDVFRVICCSLVSVVSTVFSVFTLSDAVNTERVSRTTMLGVVVAANLVALGAIPWWANLSDRIGRRRVFITGALGSAALIWPYLWAINTSRISLIFLFGILLSGLAYSASNGVWPALYGEMFNTRVRLSGMAIGTQIGFALGGFAPSISAVLLRGGPSGWMPVALFTTLATLVAASAAWSARETCNLPMSELGKARTTATP